MSELSASPTTSVVSTPANSSSSKIELSPAMRALVGVMIGVAVFLVLGFLVMVAYIVHGLNGNNNAGVKEVYLNLPAGSLITETQVMKDRLAVTTMSPEQGSQIFMVNPKSGAVLSVLHAGVKHDGSIAVNHSDKP